jgi:hypothetical protein
MKATTAAAARVVTGSAGPGPAPLGMGGAGGSAKAPARSTDLLTRAAPRTAKQPQRQRQRQGQPFIGCAARRGTDPTLTGRQARVPAVALGGRSTAVLALFASALLSRRHRDGGRHRRWVHADGTIHMYMDGTI